jgi:hypothetical protein
MKVMLVLLEVECIQFFFYQVIYNKILRINDIIINNNAFNLHMFLYSKCFNNNNKYIKDFI